MKLRSLLAITTFGLTSLAFADAGHEHAAASPATDRYPLTTCIVSGDKLGEMGDPVKYTYKQAGQPDRELQFCCKDCIKDFEKDPAKYLAAYDAAKAGKGTVSDASGASKPSGLATADGMSGCCAAGGDAACCELVTGYLPIADALATDNLARAKDAAAALAKQADAGGMKTIYQPALALVHAADLPAARAAFKTLSKEVIPLVKGAKGYVVMNCPMANADWIQTDAKVRNPYYGKAMLTCGAPKK